MNMTDYHTIIVHHAIKDGEGPPLFSSEEGEILPETETKNNFQKIDLEIFFTASDPVFPLFGGGGPLRIGSD